VPISGGFWTPWIPTAIAQRWPVCWWVLNVIDHFSRRSLGCGVFQNRPTSAEVTAVLDRIISAEQKRPKHVIVDQGTEFKCEHFEHVWCQAQDILPRFGAVGQHGSIAVVERFHRTLKELLRLTTIPEDQTAFERELGLIIDWYNEHRPHETTGRAGALSGVDACRITICARGHFLSLCADCMGTTKWQPRHWKNG